MSSNFVQCTACKHESEDSCGNLHRTKRELRGTQGHRVVQLVLSFLENSGKYLTMATSTNQPRAPPINTDGSPTAGRVESDSMVIAVIASPAGGGMPTVTKEFKSTYKLEFIRKVSPVRVPPAHPFNNMHANAGLHDFMRSIICDSHDFWDMYA